MKGLATRLNLIMARHRILHRAQEGFILGGATGNCIDVVLDVWETARARKRACYNIFYDVAAAYDSITHECILRSLRRLCMPEGFLNLVQDSLSGLMAHVRTAFGPSSNFEVKRSLKQGCPLACLCCNCVLDPLHCGLEYNPLYGGCTDGYNLDRDMRIASKGFADDTWVVSETVDGLSTGSWPFVLTTTWR
jgi:hypothetical protein